MGGRHWQAPAFGGSDWYLHAWDIKYLGFVLWEEYILSYIKLSSIDILLIFTLLYYCHQLVSYPIT